MRSQNARRPASAGAENRPHEDHQAGQRDGFLTKPKRCSNQVTVATITKSHSCQLRVSISTWRGQTKVEIADLTSVIPSIYFQAGAGVTIPIEKLDDLIGALAAVKNGRAPR